MFFWNSLAFSIIQQMLAIWSLVPFAFSKTNLNIWNFMVHALLKPGLEAWRAAIHGVVKSWTRVSDWTELNWTYTGKDWGQEVKGMTEDEMVAWHHRLNGHELGESLGWTARPCILRFMGSQRVRYDWETELNWTELMDKNVYFAKLLADIYWEGDKCQKFDKWKLNFSS